MIYLQMNFLWCNHLHLMISNHGLDCYQYLNHFSIFTRIPRSKHFYSTYKFWTRKYNPGLVGHLAKIGQVLSKLGKPIYLDNTNLSQPSHANTMVSLSSNIYRSNCLILFICSWNWIQVYFIFRFIVVFNSDLMHLSW